MNENNDDLEKSVSNREKRDKRSVNNKLKKDYNPSEIFPANFDLIKYMEGAGGKGDVSHYYNEKKK